MAYVQAAKGSGSSRVRSYSCAVLTREAQPRQLQLIWAMSSRMNWGIFCWARTLTRLLESCAGRCFSKTGRKLHKVHSGSPGASRNRSERGSRSEVVADRQSLRGIDACTAQRSERRSRVDV